MANGGMGYYQRDDLSFLYLRGPGFPRWRPAQVGALSGLVAHWAVHRSVPALLSLPTGAGKSAIATAIPYLAASRRVLVLVPSTHLRTQLATAFRTQAVLSEIGAIDHLHMPNVVEVADQSSDWSRLEDADVVVAIPASISAAYRKNPPPDDFFDLMIVDEAHHAPAPTWQALLDHHVSARRVLLTATPRRRDNKRVPGEVAFHYPLGHAISDGTYHPLQPEVIDLPPDADRSAYDRAVATRALEILSEQAHATSTFLVRASSARRAHDLAALYAELGREVVVLTSVMSEAKQTQIVAGLRDGTIRSVAVVGMLSEGFDLPSLRVAAYHDKHRSVAPTIQLIGRLVRASPSYPQPSLLVVARDIDVFPALQGAVRDLYAEDADWAALLPGLIDDEIGDAIASREFASKLQLAPPELSVEALAVPVRAIVYETRNPEWLPDMPGCLSLGFTPGTRIRGGHEVFYASLTPDGSTLVAVTQRRESPAWHAHAGLDSVRFDLHLFTWLPPNQPDQSGLLLSNTDSTEVYRHLCDALDVSDADVKPADPDRMQDAFDALPRVSVSNVGVRNTYAGSRGTASYKTFAGSGVDRGMREGDTAQSAIGHAMAQVSRGDGKGAYNAGIAVEKAKFWESRPTPLREYEDIMRDFARRYWSSGRSINPLLPDVARGSALATFPQCPVVFVELHHRLLGGDWHLDGELLEVADIHVDVASETELHVAIFTTNSGDSPVWAGRQQIDGTLIEYLGGTPIKLGLSDHTIPEVLEEHPLSVFFLDGSSLSGPVVYERPRVVRDLNRIRKDTPDWGDTNVRKETGRSSLEGPSIQTYVQNDLRGRSQRLTHRWLLHNDGKGEIADLIVLELEIGGAVLMDLWHLKPAGGVEASVRVTDMEVVVAQAVKSRRWFTDASLWSEMSRRLNGTSAPPLTVLDGDPDLLAKLLATPTGEEPWTLAGSVPSPRGEIVIAQPGLSWALLESRLRANEQTAIQIRDLLAVFDDAIGNRATTRIVCSN